MYQCKCHSYLDFSCWLCKYDTSPVCLSVSLSPRCYNFHGVCYCAVCVSGAVRCSICDLNIRNYYFYFLCRECVLYIWSWMFFLFVRRTLVDNPGILVDKFHFYYIYLFAAVALVCFVLCYAYGRTLLFPCLERALWLLLFLYRCKWR
jgi:hypothetical protein